MKLRAVLTVSLLAFALTCSSEVFAQSSTSTTRKERHIWRIVGTISGVFGGIALGWAISDDDALNATQKAVRNMTICAAAGGVGGYFLGRVVDKKLAYRAQPDMFTIRQAQARALDSVVKERARMLNLETDKDKGDSALFRR